MYTMFDGKADTYQNARPSYPMELVQAFAQLNGVKPLGITADIGAGTGLFSKSLLDAGFVWVQLVEPNPDMLSSARQNLQAYAENVQYIQAPAEQTTLQDASVDQITVAQAFHWFDVLAFQQECARILKPNGKVLLLWNDRDMNAPIMQKLDALNTSMLPHYRGFSGGVNRKVALEQFFYDGDCLHYTYPFPLAWNKEQFIGRNLSSSFSPKCEDAEYMPYLKALEELFHAFASKDTIHMPHITSAYIGSVFPT